MSKTILITGSTDGIGFEAAQKLAAAGHRILLHGRNPEKLDKASAALSGANETYLADLSRLDEVETLARSVARTHDQLDVLINNAGVYKTSQPLAADGLDARFVVNAIAPYVLTRRLLPLMDSSGRVINLSSAAQATVDLDALQGKRRLGDMEAYAQSKLAITVWSRALAKALKDGPSVIALNPGSLLATKMVRDGFGVEGKDAGIGADILYRASLSQEFSGHSGDYFDNDAGCFAQPHAAVSDATHSDTVMHVLNTYAGPF